MNRRFLFVIALLVGCLSMQAGRKQWTEKQAWERYNRIGVIKGFNQPEPAYPGQDRKEILRKAAEMGLNSVRFWVGGRNTEERVAYIQGMIADAKLFGLTVSPVLAIPVPGLRNAEKELSADIIKEFEQQVRGVVRPFAREKQISFWDLWNEPRFEDIPLTYREMDLIEKMVIWCRDENLSQPITSSIIWASPNTDNKALKRTTEVEKPVRQNQRSRLERFARPGAVLPEQTRECIRIRRPGGQTLDETEIWQFAGILHDVIAVPGGEVFQIVPEQCACTDLPDGQSDFPVHGRGIGYERGKQSQRGIIVRVSADKPRKGDVDIRKQATSAELIQQFIDGRHFPFPFRNSVRRFSRQSEGGTSNQMPFCVPRFSPRRKM